ncbi:transglutaminase family protein [Thiosocius teredinicola]|uniref:transglutaminase family protein n=1 Tax=Thiosocius teredinicola TaxID=1973002 RepID=UPI000990B050
MQEKEAARFESAIQAHDAAVANVGKSIWVGAEPTFTLFESESPEWLNEALGGNKQSLALRMVGEIRRRHPGCLVMRTVGRQYADEDYPRWSFGIYQRRDDSPVWAGPPDPLMDTSDTAKAVDLDAFTGELQRALIAAGWNCKPFRAPEDFERRLLLWHGDSATVDLHDERLGRPSVHEHPTPDHGLSDELAAEGLLLLAIGEIASATGKPVACIELPEFSDVAQFLAVLSAVEKSAQASALSHLVFRGYPPPVDQDIAWTTFTPDPAVIEVNQAPQSEIRPFLRASQELYEVASSLRLAPYRMHYNGGISDSGGGGQFTLGGPSAIESPFLVDPVLLPRLVRYVNQHPALSYWFATAYIGAASQSPRVDEGTRDAFHELAFALEQLEDAPHDTSPASLWASLAPFLADPSGNSHRSELNIEKLWNPYLAKRGYLGLVEFRAFRMPHSPQRAAAVAALLRAIAAMLAIADPVSGLQDWGNELHDRFALPHFLVRDLKKVFTDLQTYGLGLDPVLQQTLTDDPLGSRWTTTFGGCQLCLEQALEFWPLVGDVASQESGGSRLVDSSTLRLQISLHAADADAPDLQQWQLRIGDIEIPLRDVQDASGALRLIGLRYRDFVPWRGLHPNIPAQPPLVFTLSHPVSPDAVEITLHNWQPQGKAYAGLPTSIEDAGARLAERLVVRPVSRAELPPAKQAPAHAASGYTFDYRRCVQTPSDGGH